MKIKRSIIPIENLDYKRSILTGIPEVVLGEGKTHMQIWESLKKLAKVNKFSFATRVNKKKFMLISKERAPLGYDLIYYEDAQILYLCKKDFSHPCTYGPVGLFSAGTSDLRVAEEARITLEILGCKVITYYDIGVAGIHRYKRPLAHLKKAGVKCIIVVAGREATLPTLIKSMVDVLVIGVPTSCGYGYGRAGRSALFSILQSCSPGIVAVNIDNGFGAACSAYLVAKVSSTTNKVSV